MSSTYKSTSTSFNAHEQPQSDDSGLNGNYLPNTPYQTSLLSPFNYPQTHSNSASPSYNVNSTPGESLSEYSNYQPSEFSELEADDFFGVDFDAGVLNRIDSLPNTLSYLPQNVEHSSATISQEAEIQHSLGDLTKSRFPPSPKPTSIPNTPSPRSSANDLMTQPSVSQHELLNQLHNSRFQPFTPQTQAHPTTIELTPDLSGGSDTSAEGIDSGAMNHQEHAQNVTSQWGNTPIAQSDAFMQPAEQFGSDESKITQFNSPNMSQSSEPRTQATGLRNDEGEWRSDERTGQAGLSPEARKAIADAEVPTFKEQAENRRLENKINEVREWRSQAGGSSDAEDENPDVSYFNDFNSDTWQQPHRVDTGEQADIAPVDDAASIRENRIIEGQVYFDEKATTLSRADIKHMQQSRHWSDAPMVPHMTLNNFQQPATANEAMKKFNDNSDAMSLTSRAATWGTRRRSETNLTDLEGITDGSFLKRLSISKSKDSHRRQNSIFDQGLDRLANIVRNRSDSRLKRNRSSQNISEQTEKPSRQSSQSSHHGLAPPRSSFSKGATPSVNTMIASMTGPLAAVGATHAHARSGSVTANVANTNTSPKSPTGSGSSNHHLGFGRTVINRVRSRSELSTIEKSQKQGGIVGLWKTQGGPPVAHLPVSPPVDEIKPSREVLDMEDEEDEDDEQLDESDMKVSSEEQEPITANYEGFKSHIRRLNPEMAPHYNWLVSRIAHQQEIRYKNLLDLRVKHKQNTSNGPCNAGHLCSAVGGSATLLDAKGNPRVSETNNNALHLVTDFSDDSNPGEGALTDETFPPGVPMPPSRNLPAEFECQLCFKAKKFQKPSDWTKHVHEDVQPFTCTYDKCKEPKSFKRKADWVRHENERHRHLEWWVCQMDDCKHPCFRKDNFLQHLVREHKLPEPKQKTKAAIKKARLTEPAWIMLEKCHHETQNKPQDEPCKFCGKSFNTWKKLTVHLAKHMEHISLPVLRLVEQRLVDANTIISPVEQILTPISPASRAKLEAHSPFNMNSISPHVPSAMQFTSGFEQPAYYHATTSAGTNYGMQAQMNPGVNFEQSSAYPPPYAFQSMGPQARGFGSLDSSNVNTMGHNRGFGSMDSTFSHGKVEQTRSFNPSFNHVLPSQGGYNQQQPQYSMSNEYVANTPPVSGYQSSSMLGDTIGYGGYDQMAVNPQHYPQIPMSRAPGSASSYGHSPQNPPQNPYYGPQ